MFRRPLAYRPLLGHFLRLGLPREARAIWLRPGHAEREIFFAQPSDFIILKQGDSPETSGGLAAHNTLWPQLEALLKNANQRWPELPADCPGPIAGYIGYPSSRPAPASGNNIPFAYFGAYELIISIDHSRRMAEAVILSNNADNQPIWKRILEIASGTSSGYPDFRLCHDFKAHTSKTRYLKDIRTIKNYLAAGDCYQVNYTQALSAACFGHSAYAMQRLLEVSHAPYAAWLSLPEGDVLSLSPELFIEVKDGRMRTKPIKGTAPRLDDKQRDAVQATQLQQSSKCQAENLMIVDLLRNDFGQHAQIGSVRVDDLFAVESLPQVHHLVSTISACLRQDSNSVRLLRDCFPGGSITGAPKKRAMEIIDELEPVARSVYCGSIGHLHPNGDCQFNIAIRTLVRQDNQITAWAGGGIVADSDPEAEYQECFDKIGLLMSTLESM